jgi:hypothetical protein
MRKDELNNVNVANKYPAKIATNMIVLLFIKSCKIKDTTNVSNGRTINITPNGLSKMLLLDMNTSLLPNEI